MKAVRYATQPDHAIRGESLTLADWLDVDWFYPEGFQKERVIDTPRSLLVFGDSIVYKFLKSDTVSGSLSFAQRWAEACAEVLDNRELASDLYVGLRLLRWIDDEPHWITEYRGSELRPAEPPEHADEVAIVMRRIPDRAKLSDCLLDNGELRLDQLETLIEQLSRFHQRRKKRGKMLYADDPLEAAAMVEEATLGGVDSFLQEYEGYLDPFSKLALGESAAFLRRMLVGKRGVFTGRARRGFVIDSHGGLRARCIAIDPLLPESRTISIFQRAPREQRQRDMLADIASLAVDIELYGAGYLAREIARRYDEAVPGAFDAELFRFYMVAESTAAAMEYIQQVGSAQTLRANRAFSLALRYALGLMQQFAVFVSGTAEDDCEGLAKALAELADAELFEPASAVGGLGSETLSDVFAFERLRERAARALEEGSSVVVCWPSAETEQRAVLHRLAQAQGVPHILISCLEPPKNILRPGLEPLDRPLLPQPELALDVLRELARRTPPA